MEQLGFPNKTQAAYQPSVPSGRPEGKWFLGILLFGAFIFTGYKVWDAYFHYHSYGVVSGRMISVSVPVNGILQHLYVKEGDKVQQGQLLGVIENSELRHRYETLKDDLANESAQLTATLAKLKLEYAFRLDNNVGTQVSYVEALSNLANEEAKLVEYDINVKRYEKIHAQRALADAEWTTYKYTWKGQRDKVLKLREAVENLKGRAQNLDKLGSKDIMLKTWTDQLRPHVTKISNLQGQMERVAIILHHCKIESPINGTVVKRYNYSGEYCSPEKPLFAIMEENSTEIVLYVPQENVHSYPQDKQLTVLVSPNAEKVPCTVKRHGDRYDPPPESIKRFYSAGQHLMPVYCSVDDAADLRFAATVKVPYRWRD